MKMTRFNGILSALLRCFAIAFLAVSLAAGCTDNGEVDEDEPTNKPGNTQNPGGGKDNPGKDNPGGTDNSGDKLDAKANREFTDYVMDSYYLWNEAYRETKKNFNQNYDKYFEDVLDQMYKKGQNLQDGHYYSGNGWEFYSYIDRWASRADTRATASDRTFGLGLYCWPVMFTSRTYVYYVVWYVYPDSPADKAGFKRGDIISKVNGAQITTSNYGRGLYYQVLADIFSTSTTVTLTLVDVAANGSSYTVEERPETIDLKTNYYYPNPTVYSNAWEIKGQKIGYAVYTGFEMAFDKELEAVFADFKTLGVENIILDLRYNGGGHVISSRKLSSIIAGPVADGKVFAYYRYNNERMAKEYPRADINNPKTYKAETFDSALAKKYGFDGKIYVIGSENTASASELLVNALRGIDREVTLVGYVKTNGKDVGMEVLTTNNPIDGYYYQIAPISFQTYNDKGESDYDDGFTPDLKPAIDYELSYPYSDWGLPTAATAEDSTVDSATGTVKKYDFIVDAICDLVGGNFTLDDVKTLVADDSAEPATRAAGLRPRNVGAIKTDRSSRLTMPMRNPLKHNMIIEREVEFDEEGNIRFAE